jgi:flavin reductase (DIM6/NTAB) family NADH-FMN oxidoreductase RutF
MAPPDETTNAFDRIAATVPSPVVIATTRRGDDLGGCLVGFTTQCSIDPLRYLVCLSAANRTYELATGASTIVVHLLHDDDHDLALARLFGEATGFVTDKFERCAWHPGPDGVPVLDGCDWFAGTIVDRSDLGDHVGFRLAPLAGGRAERTSEPWLSYPDVRELHAGNPA